MININIYRVGGFLSLSYRPTHDVILLDYITRLDYCNGLHFDQLVISEISIFKTYISTERFTQQKIIKSLVLQCIDPIWRNAVYNQPITKPLLFYPFLWTNKVLRYIDQVEARLITPLWSYLIKNNSDQIDKVRYIHLKSCLLFTASID